jgi:hypothetical protein
MDRRPIVSAGRGTEINGRKGDDQLVNKANIGKVDYGLAVRAARNANCGRRAEDTVKVCMRLGVATSGVNGESLYQLQQWRVSPHICH